MELINFLNIVSTVILICLAFVVGYYLGTFKPIDKELQKIIQDAQQKIDKWDGNQSK